jgi:hypothetical protein
MTAMTFPCVVNETHWFVLVHYADLGGNDTALVAFFSKDCSEAQAECRVQQSGGSDAKVFRYDVVFFARCVTCGEQADAESLLMPFRSWDALADHVRSTPGWSVTSEQLVLCPRDRSDREE